jgi:hypothetical protein
MKVRGRKYLVVSGPNLNFRGTRNVSDLINPESFSIILRYIKNLSTAYFPFLLLITWYPVHKTARTASPGLKSQGQSTGGEQETHHCSGHHVYKGCRDPLKQRGRTPFVK